MGRPRAGREERGNPQTSTASWGLRNTGWTTPYLGDTPEAAAPPTLADSDIRGSHPGQHTQ